MLTPDEQHRSPEDHVVFLSLGSNLGDRRRQLQRALDLLSQQMTIEQISSVYDTAPMLVTEQPRFLNLVCRARTALSPHDVLALLKSTEQQMGRTAGIRYGPRVIDIDLLFYDALVLDTPSLTLPHPRIAERAFVLLPLAEIAPAFVHPALNRTVADLAQQVAEADVQPMGPLFSSTG
jgi:2-amino-4-hydroxy-6-hydroxymethyldihydropteridine diphosphokinase